MSNIVLVNDSVMIDKGFYMNNVIRKKKKTLFGRIVRKVESELAQKDEHKISPHLSPDDCCKNNEDAIAIELRRAELKSKNEGNLDTIKFSDL